MDWCKGKFNARHAYSLNFFNGSRSRQEKKKTAQPLARHVQYNAAKKKKKKTKPE
jgi:hypothetical protein